jgi:hypothetical protein
MTPRHPVPHVDRKEVGKQRPYIGGATASEPQVRKGSEGFRTPALRFKVEVRK